MKKTRLIMTLFIGLILWLTSCTPQPSISTPTTNLVADGTLRPYPSDTPTQTPLPTGYISPTPSPTITPTWTPVYYNVTDSDDMFGIALRYGISLEALKTANPTVNPYYMGVGTVLLIPLTPKPESTPFPTVAFTPTPTPLYSKLYQPQCFQDTLGGLTCFIQVENASSSDLENVGGLLILTDTETGEQRAEVAIMPLNLLKASMTLPMVATFKAPLPLKYTLSFDVDIILPVFPGDTRYVETQITKQQINFGANNRSARISGTIELIEGSKAARSVWILAVAYDSDGHVIGLRRWEAPGAFAPNTSQPFDLTVYSLSKEIDHITLYTEAKAELP
ncbi:MAG: LysM peptidoglycan-binding domain-containing protein [Anaerolineaceae bacterium]|nr:LysM peptidoglycan-binding domain-containing protein [Anaerolineaceae bacterium]